MAAVMSGHIEPMIGRYVHVDIGGETHRIYFEENGAGIPLVCLHTAGSDNRQWRHLLADEEFAKNFRIIAFDMPLHGKSNPPASWSGEEYQLTTARYTETDPRLLQGAEARKARGDGLLDRRPHRAQSRDRSCRRIPRADRAGSRRFPGAVVRHRLAQPSRRPWRRSLRRAGVRPYCAAEPAKPRARETLWAYKQGGPGVFKGDLYFYRVDGDLRGGSRQSILKYVRSICSRASMISPARRKTPGGPLPRSAAPVSPSWKSSVISR